MALKIADLILVGLAHVENEEIVSTIESGFQIAWRNLRHLHRRAGSFFAANAAKFVVIDEFVNRAMRAAHGAVRVLAQLELAESHSQCVKQEQATNEIVPTAENELDCFHRLDRANDSGQNAEHSAFRAGRHESRWRRFGIEAAVARPVGHAENADLPFEPENRAVHVGLTEQNARVIHEVASRKIVRAVHDDIEVFEQIEGVGAGQLCFERLDLDIRIEVRKARPGGLALGLAHIAAAKGDLALEICEVDDIKVNQAKLTDTRGRKIQAKRRAKSARADEQDFGVFQLELPLHADFRHDKVAAVSQNFFIRKARGRFRAGRRLCCGGHFLLLTPHYDAAASRKPKRGSSPRSQ